MILMNRILQRVVLCLVLHALAECGIFFHFKLRSLNSIWLGEIALDITRENTHFFVVVIVVSGEQKILPVSRQNHFTLVEILIPNH